MIHVHVAMCGKGLILTDVVNLWKDAGTAAGWNAGKTGTAKRAAAALPAAWGAGASENAHAIGARLEARAGAGPGALPRAGKRAQPVVRWRDSSPPQRCAPLIIRSCTSAQSQHRVLCSSFPSCTVDPALWTCTIMQ
jgi:hypothetical protein